MRRGLGLLLLCLLTFTFGLGESAITDSDEAYYAEAGREMLVSGDWTTPHYNFEPRLQKPILFYWLIAATYSIGGVTEFNARLWSALAGVGVAFVAAAVGRRWFGPAEGWLAGAIVATSFGVVPLARQALPDMPLALFVSLAIWAALEAVSIDTAAGPRRRSPRVWLMVSSAAAALGMLDKGPVALVLPFTVLVPMLIWQRRQGETWPRALNLWPMIAAVVLFVLIASPWYIAVMRAQGLDYARQFFIGENVERFATPTYNEWRGWMYMPVILAGLLPWTAFLLLWWRPLRDVLSRRRSFTPVQAKLLCWALGPLAFFTISVGSQPRYILPSLVPIAILLARSISVRARSERSRPDMFIAASVIAGVLMAAIGLMLWRAAATFQTGGADVSTGGPIAMVAVGVAAVVGTLMTPRRAVPALIAIAAAAQLAVFAGTLLSPARPEPVEAIAEIIRQQRPGGEVCSCGAFARNLAFYTQRHVVIANVTAADSRELMAVLDAPAPAFAAVDQQTLSAVETQTGRRYEALGDVTYLNMSVWQRGETLLRPDPSWVQRVSLIVDR